MAITFGTSRKKEKKVILIILALLIVGGVMGGFILTRKQASQLILRLETPKPNPPEINWGILEDPRLEKLQNLIQIPPLDEEPGRENPFLPY